jgi:hypothetical protein
MDALSTAIGICKWFIDLKEVNDEAKEGMLEMRGTIVRMHPVLVSLNTRGLEAASGVIENLWQCLENAKRIYVKYIDGYSFWKPWVTPGCIKGKADTHTRKVKGALTELHQALGIVDHNHMVQDQDDGPAAASNAAAAEAEGDTCGPWEIAARSIDMQRNEKNGLPVAYLGRGSFGVVGRGCYTHSTKDGSIKKLSVAVKMSMNLLADAQHDPAVLRRFKKEVNLMCTLEHPNICQCFGAVTRDDGDLVMWIVMELLDKTLHTAIIDKHLQLGRDSPEQYADTLSDIAGAVAYLHSPVNGTPIVHGGSSNLY